VSRPSVKRSRRLLLPRRRTSLQLFRELNGGCARQRRGRGGGGGRASARQNNRGIKRGRLWDQRSENVVLFQVSRLSRATPCFPHRNHPPYLHPPRPALAHPSLLPARLPQPATSSHPSPSISPVSREFPHYEPIGVLKSFSLAQNNFSKKGKSRRIKCAGCGDSLARARARFREYSRFNIRLIPPRENTSRHIGSAMPRREKKLAVESRGGRKSAGFRIREG